MTTITGAKPFQTTGKIQNDLLDQLVKMPKPASKEAQEILPANTQKVKIAGEDQDVDYPERPRA